ncbi:MULTISPECIES: NAD(P)/FAD-dependent oxidoreductase [unclassified Arthrobacter]|uniref:NAD(P)/FAD-dependent oxidoreductase n=1 Tax=unclassified Arthrobacter TaxID=235627 RepID=UPI001E4F80F8|nr:MULTISPECIES: NAD(P)/FAD-dependent oxidoreductase [unclassified Arthrobacter]MCC9145241.1 NAD(P)/FAD-dependent oxidoreductase [Arthrobacter sp. zg-Y919]MDK1276469.1 NAD(P)/FAD-dependent oxidoreductase [Arthrobacter sp. zg.Y919]WIB01932.1 NAD(P)/FAD-dependent oxidoreductase [Arthrobacter sp. zg-Y919]
MTNGEYDVVVVGGSAAGLSGALNLARARRSVAVVDSGDPRNAPAGGVHNYIGREGTPPSELTAVGRAEITGYGAVVLEGTVSTVTRDDDGRFLVSLADGGSLLARRVLAASGARDVLPDIPGLARYWGKDVLHCPYCHGWEVQDRPIGILARDLETGVHQALMWRQWSEDIVLFLHTSGEPGGAQAQQLAARGIRVVAGEVTAVEGESRLTGLRLASGEAVQRQALVIAAPVHARAAYLADLGIKPVEQFVGEQIIGTAVPAADPTGATTVPGVYAAGNMVVPMMQVIGAAAAGLAAGAAINADLIAEETERAVEASLSRRAQP